MKQKQLIFLLLILIILVGGFLRFYQLDNESLWQDEGFTLIEVDQPSFKQTFNAIIGPPEGTPPLYFIILHFWTRIFGTSEFSLRFPSAIFGMVSILLIFLIGKEIFNKKTGLISALIMSVSTIQILYSQDARAYSLFVMLTLISFLFYIKTLKSSSNKNLFFYLISTLFLLYTHHFALFVLFAQNIIFFLFHKEFYLKTKKWLISLLVLGVLYVPGILIVLSQFQHNQKSLQSALSGKLGLPLVISQLGILNFLWPVLIIFFIVLVIYYFKTNLINLIKKIRFNENIFFITISIFTLSYILILPKLIHPFFVTRFTVFTYPFFYLLFAEGFNKMRKIKLKKTISVLFLVLVILSLFTYYSTPKKEQWKEAVSFIEDKSQPNEMIIIIGDTHFTIFDYYYSNKLEVIKVNIHIDQLENQKELNNLIPQLQNKKGYWLVESNAYKTQGIYQKHFKENFNLMKGEKFLDIEVYHYI
ncbi:MAG: glycosyltransferase family 39 protein [Nanoarchaeota archaeon]|nr:glycosyltransferase family 39 protein [Nanoarchaeota archaeon]